MADCDLLLCLIFGGEDGIFFAISPEGGRALVLTLDVEGSERVSEEECWLRNVRK